VSLKIQLVDTRVFICYKYLEISLFEIKLKTIHLHSGLIFVL